MSEVRIYKAENRLGRIMKKPGGRSIAEALDAAKARIEKVRAQATGRMYEIADQLRILAKQGRAGDCAALEALYAGSNDIFAVAGYFELKALSEASFSLCDLLMAADLGAAVDWAAVDVHVEAIWLLTHAGDKVDASRLILGLRAVRARYADTMAEPKA